MKPTAKLLQPARVSAAPVPRAVALPDAVLDRKRELSSHLEIVKAAPARIAKDVDALISAMRHDSLDRPAAIPGHVVVRVVGATCNDKSIVPLPNLRVTLVSSDKTQLVARTDVTGLAIFPLPTKERATYHLVVRAGEAEVANAAATANHVHLISIGEHAGIEPHAVLGRGWMAAIAAADKKKTAATKQATSELAELASATTTKLRAVEARLDLHLGKKKS